MSVSAAHPSGIDGAHQTGSSARKAAKEPFREDICCVFVHAGAGYHSFANERIHLEACNDAAQMAMLVLRNGGSALDGAEMAVKVLEDREITNAGYGSNLAMDGVVECDASIVDHHGRSGAVGAIYKIKNPISLARLVLDHTARPLTLRRVPPNLLVSQGALDFAREMGVPELPHDALVSPAARERWVKWKADLRTAERKARKTGAPTSVWKIRAPAEPVAEEVEDQLRQLHTNELLTSNWGSTSDTTAPFSGDVLEDGADSDSGGSMACFTDPNVSMNDPYIESPKLSMDEASSNPFINSTQQVPTVGLIHAPLNSHNLMINQIREEALKQQTRRKDKWNDGSAEASRPAGVTCLNQAQNPRPALAVLHGDPRQAPVLRAIEDLPSQVNEAPVEHFCPDPGKDDCVTDTVGAIAIDGWGHIACAASSGGIGMKYRGRVGPAALVGVGAAVAAADPADPEETCVATVSSGTGEHMATTLAASVCAERLQRSVRKEPGGGFVEVTEDEALKAMIEAEFMGHPSVQHSKSAGAIGLLGVKKTRQGIMLYYAHNTDSFAMASMGPGDEVPSCTMSRNNGTAQIAQGGKMIRIQRKKRVRSAAALRH